MFLVNIPRPVTIFAMQQLAKVDHNVATRVSEAVADTVTWSYNHNYPIVAEYAISGLQTLDSWGSFLIAIVAWIVNHTI